MASLGLESRVLFQLGLGGFNYESHISIRFGKIRDLCKRL